ncbi:iron-containing alcohol dehydrogenase [Thalassotalea litorea]|uniref:iron-containing alcohol dehydrogenase n=1 Tax=Thalassotalea litorea TaxID=2020715 RepID=UPI003736CEBB
MLITLFSRLYQFGLKLFVLFFPFPKPKLYQGNEGLQDWAKTIKDKGETKLLVVTDETLVNLGVINPVIKALEAEQIRYSTFSQVQPNPTIANVEQGLVQYHNNQCQAIVAIGGGSVMDCAKLIGARAVKPKKSVKQLKGLFKILKKLPPLYAIPTTAGTGSETTIVAVISDPEVQQKYAVTDLVLAPKAAILVPELTTRLPAHITSTTGMDALTHAIESYIGNNATPFTKKRSLEACKLIFGNLRLAYNHGENSQARLAMLLGSFYAGEAFTRASVGYVHAIAHQLGAIYNTPHGLANAVLLPKILRWYGQSCQKKLAEIADHCGLDQHATTVPEKGQVVIDTIEAMNRDMAIPNQLTEVKNQDIDKIVDAALKEAQLDYPVPRFMEKADCRSVVEQLLA